MSTQMAVAAKPSLVHRFAGKMGVDPHKLLATLKATAFRVKDGEATDEQMMALLVVAEQHSLNPFTKEIFAFPDKQNGIIPVVSVDGWTRIINEHPQLNGIEFKMSDEIVQMDEHAKPCPAWCEVWLYRKDRDRPIVIREYLDEVYRPPYVGKSREGEYTKSGPWQTHTKRFLRHKTLIQGARIAFGFAGIYDEDEANRIVEAQVVEQAKPETIKPPQRASAQKNAEKDPTPPPPAETETVVEATIVGQTPADHPDPEPPQDLGKPDPKPEAKTDAPAKPHVKGQATPGFIKMLRDQAAAKGITEATLCEQFQLESLDQGISARLGNDILNYLADVA